MGFTESDLRVALMSVLCMTMMQGVTGGFRSCCRGMRAWGGSLEDPAWQVLMDRGLDMKGNGSVEGRIMMQLRGGGGPRRPKGMQNFQKRMREEVDDGPQDTRAGAGGSGITPRNYGKGKRKRDKVAGPDESQVRAAEKKEGLQVLGQEEGKNAWRRNIATRAGGLRVLDSESEGDADEPAPKAVDPSVFAVSAPFKAKGQGDDGEEEEEGLNKLAHVGPVKFQYDQEEQELEEQLQLRAKKLRDKREKEEAERRGSLSAKWTPNGTACQAWDWFQGRADDGHEYTTLRNREYGYILQLYDNTEFAWFQYSRMSGTGAVYTVYSDSHSVIDEEGFYGQDLVDALINQTEIQGKSMSFRCQRDGDAIIFRHSYWLGIVHGPHIRIKHAKKLQTELHLTTQGFVFVGEDSYFQGAGGSFVKELGRAGVVWVQGPRPAKWIKRSRGIGLLKRQRTLCEQGDLMWKGIAKEARLADAEEDAKVGAEEEANAVPLVTRKRGGKQEMSMEQSIAWGRGGAVTMKDDFAGLIYTHKVEEDEDWLGKRDWGASRGKGVGMQQDRGRHDSGLSGNAGDGDIGQNAFAASSE